MMVGENIPCEKLGTKAFGELLVSLL
jgi:hypothetical protein